MFILKEPEDSVVCPVCWKRCKLFQKLSFFKFTSLERRQYLSQFHNQVCDRCKRQKCRPFIRRIKLADGTKVDAGIVPCCAHPAKKLSNKKRLPEWWS